MNKRILIFCFCFVAFFYGYSQSISVQQYIDTYKGIAISEMQRTGVPAAITLAQGLLETQNGNSDLLKASNNHFGIKCKSTWTGETVSHDDDAPGECFRKYKCAEDSYRDHSNFLKDNSRYSFLFNLDPTDYKGWAMGLSKAGYATNPKYSQTLIKYIEDNNLEQYTADALNEVPHLDIATSKDEPVITPPPSGAATVAYHPDNQDPQINAPVRIKINGCKALYVPKGTSLLAIATEHRINLEKLLSMNDLSQDGILQKSQYIFLEKKKKEGREDFCISEQDETMYDISQKYGVILQNLYAYNQFSPDDYLVAGTKIFLKPPLFKGATPATADNLDARNDTDRSLPVAAAARSTTHQVQAKESLYGISKKYGVSVADLKKWNNLDGDHIKTGQQLIISK